MISRRSMSMSKPPASSLKNACAHVSVQNTFLDCVTSCAQRCSILRQVCSRRGLQDSYCLEINGSRELRKFPTGMITDRDDPALEVARWRTSVLYLKL